MAKPSVIAQLADVASKVYARSVQAGSKLHPEGMTTDVLATVNRNAWCDVVRAVLKEVE